MIQTLTLVAECALPHGPGAVLVRVAVALEGVRAAPVLAAGQRHAVVAQVALPEITFALLKWISNILKWSERDRIHELTIRPRKRRHPGGRTRR